MLNFLTPVGWLAMVPGGLIDSLEQAQADFAQQ
jgi:hypothetical protein